jgi:hypothetical protein
MIVTMFVDMSSHTPFSRLLHHPDAHRRGEHVETAGMRRDSCYFCCDAAGTTGATATSTGRAGKARTASLVGADESAP